jgi:hypothetical protein
MSGAAAHPAEVRLRNRTYRLIAVSTWRLLVHLSERELYEVQQVQQVPDVHQDRQGRESDVPAGAEAQLMAVAVVGTGDDVPEAAEGACELSPLPDSATLGGGPVSLPGIVQRPSRHTKFELGCTPTHAPAPVRLPLPIPEPGGCQVPAWHVQLGSGCADTHVLAEAFSPESVLPAGVVAPARAGVEVEEAEAAAAGEIREVRRDALATGSRVTVMTSGDWKVSTRARSTARTNASTARRPVIPEGRRI